jgi:hypothetical protein
MIEGAGPNPDGNSVEKLRCCAVRTAGQAKFIRQHVGGSRRQRAKDYPRPNDAVQNFVDGAIAARGQNHVKTALDGGASELAGHVGASGRHQLNFASGAAEAFDGGVEPGASGTSQSARAGIEDDSYTL